MISPEVLSKKDLPSGVTILPASIFWIYPASSSWCKAPLTIAPLPFLIVSGLTPLSFFPP